MPPTNTKPGVRKAPPKATKEAELKAVFAEVKALLAKFAPPFEPRSDAKGGYHLWSNKPAVAHGRKRDEIYFAGAVPQKGYVGFYYMPVYAEPDVKAMFKPELLSLLKGKSCFYVKQRDPVVMKQIKSALSDGLRLYNRNKWV